MTLRRDPRIEVLAAETLLDGRIFDVVEETIRLPSGLEQRLQMVDHNGAVAIAAIDDNGALLLVRQYRHAAGAWMLELPAGRLEPDEEPLDAAQRELEEETGYSARSWEVLRTFYPAPGFCSEYMTVFLAHGLELVENRRAHDEDEELDVVTLTPKQVLEGDVVDAKTLLAAALVNGATSA
jgi:ADP-ribose pyrophosphatase